MPKAKRQRSIVDAKYGVQQPKRQRTDKPRSNASGAPSKQPAGHGQGSLRQQPQIKPWSCISIIDKQAASAVDRLIQAAETHRHGATIKSLTLAPHIENKKATYAVTCETLKHLTLLKELEAAVGLLQQQPRLTKGTVYVLLYEALLGKGLKAQGPAERPVMARIAEIKEAMQRVLQQAGAQSAAQYLQAQQQAGGQQQGGAPAQPVQHPRSVRVNTLKGSVEDALKRLKKISPQLAAQCKRDKLLPDLLLLPAGTPLHDHPMVADGRLVLQSKSSCMPAHALAPQPGWVVVDCCAAPGNKTTHLAALMKNKGTIRAFDRDAKRIKRLQANAAQRGASCITATCQDFLSVEPEEAQYAGVCGVLLDPSCSGSGTAVSRMDHLLPAAGPAAGAAPAAAEAGVGSEEQQQQQQQGVRDEAERVESLARFQEACLRHALRFPGLQRLVYSTCSVHQRENEDVVGAVLHDACAAGFQLKDPFPGWHRRGLPLWPGCDKLVRVDPLQDGTEGFFVAVLERGAGGGEGGGCGGGGVMSEVQQPKQQQQPRKKLAKTKQKPI